MLFIQYNITHFNNNIHITNYIITYIHIYYIYSSTSYAADNIDCVSPPSL